MAQPTVEWRNDASSRMATGNRNRTSGLRLSLPSEDAAPLFRSMARAAAWLAGVAVATSLCVGVAQAQVAVTPDNTPAVGPGGPFYPKVQVCNQTNLPVAVEGYRFRTQNYAGYTTWMPGLTHTGTAPVEYTQPIPESERQMQAGQCRAAATDYTSGTLTAGQIATLFDGQALIKTGSCAEAPKYTDAAAHSCTEVDPIRTNSAYTESRCLVDTIGANGGDTYGGFVSTFAGQTQIQFSIPQNTFVVSNTQVKFNPYAYGPQYMMALAGAQELVNVDMQFLASVAGKETFMGLVRAENGARLDIVPVQAGVYGYWQVESATFNTWVKSYPQFFPKYGPCISRYPDVSAAFPACAPSMEEPAIHFLRPTPTTQMGINSPQLINGALVTSLGFYTIYDAMVLGTDLCFLDIIKNGRDPRIALAAMLPAYNSGRYTDFAGPLKTPGIRDDPNASSRFSDGTTGYRSNIFNVLDQLVNAGKNCGPNRQVYDTAISLNEVQRFVFGGSSTPGTPAVQGDGGLLLHYEMTVAQRQTLWDSVTCAFDKLKGKAPSTSTPAKASLISYRYDWLTILRVVKKFLPMHIKDRRVPVEHDFNYVVKNYSRNPQVCGTNRPKDATYPSLTLTSPRPGDQVDQNKAPGTAFSFKATDVGGNVAKSEWTLDRNWGVWKPATKGAADSWEFNVPCETPGWPKAGQGGKLWISTTDDCGNTTVQELAFTVKAGTYCGDAPPLDPPVANPPGGGFYDSVMVTLEVPGVTGVTIHYTVDGSKPTTSSPVYSGPIRISGNANVTLRAFATKPGLSPSAEESWTFTKETRPLTATPVANPPGRTFTDADPEFPVTLSSETGAVIHFTTDGSPATLSSPVYTGPITVGTTMTINAIAIAPNKGPSRMMTAVFTETKSPIPAQKGVLLDENGDGRMEKVLVTFAKALPAAPARINFTVVGPDGQSHARSAAAAEITRDAANPAVAVVVLANPFPFGVTSLGAGSSGRTIADAAIPVLDADFPLEEQAAPVIIKAVVHEGDSLQPMKRIAITYSEPVKGPAGASQTAWVFKKETGEMASSEVRIAQVQGSDREFNVFIDTASARFPIRGDSVAIATGGEITDAAGNAPKAKLFRLMEGEAPKAKPVRFTILFPNGSQDRPSRGSLSTHTDALFIPIGGNGLALAGSKADGRCDGCTAKEGDSWIGPVLNIQTPGPLTYTFAIFNNTGEFVARGTGRVTQGEMDLLKKDRAGVNWEIPVVWTGNTDKGRKAGTGAYIVMATFLLEKDLRTGAGPAKYTEKKVFGLIRNL